MLPVNEYVAANNLNLTTELISGISLQKSFKNIWTNNISRVLKETDYLLFTAHSLPRLKSESNLWRIEGEYHIRHDIGSPELMKKKMEMYRE